MASSQEYVDIVCENISGIGNIRYRKMFGEYMIYIDELPIILVCDNTPYIKQKEELEKLMKNSDKGIPYNGAKEHFILDIDDRDLTFKALNILKEITPLPKPKKKKI